MRTPIYTLTLLLFLTLFSCDFLNKKEEKMPIARVNNSYLYYDDIELAITKGISKEDSTLIITNYIARWATQRLLVDGAKLNLTPEKQKRFKKLVKQYENDLFSKSYLEALVHKNLDTIVTNEEALDYYTKNKEAFKLNEELIKLRYISFDESNSNYKDIVKKFKRFNSSDKKELDSISLQFKSYSLKDSIWVKTTQVMNKIPIITINTKKQLLKKSNFVHHKDSLGVYLMQIKDVLLRNNIAPIEYVKPTIDQIVINKRKLELVKKIEKEIRDDAYKNKQFEEYN